ncbi:MAG TPA: ADP-ribosylglycohydrolase family protein [Ktedonobacteraceae bacterium]|nr:ADP-ribosylglycohydrolase family protein [Ktedonobacteraceae bacterium]
MEQAIPPHDQDEQLARAMCSLEGLSVGDAFGEQFFHQLDLTADSIAARMLPSPPWPYTDDTQMALSIVSILRQHGAIDQDRLAESFAERYDPSRGYGPAMHRLLRSIHAGNPWKEAASSQFAGQGSFGNGAAMRVTPIGAFFAEAMDDVVEQAVRSAQVTHTHPEAIAGGIAVAVAAAWAWRLRHSSALPSRAEFLDLIVPFVPTSEVLRKIRWARDLSATVSVEAVADLLGNGTGLSAQDTVPFVLWCAGEHLESYEQALWLTASGFGDVDTTCAMVGGIIALSRGVEDIPVAWRQAREPLPNWPFVSAYRPLDEQEHINLHG